MKKGLVKLSLLTATSLSSLGIVMATLAWFSNLVTVDNTRDTSNNIDGSTMGAYFAYGNGIPTGSGNRVYGINKPRHLYNLAWLQYLGYFEDRDGDSQFYFEIDPNLEGELDMTGWTLPPIGTAEHPFLGNFNGNGKVISNLTISSEFSNYNTHPSDVRADNFTSPDIVGFFGVVGNYDGAIDEEDYDSSANEIKTLGLKNIIVETNSPTTLAGIAAGYVDATIENVAIENPTLVISNQSADNYSDSLTNNISDYLAVGYCNDSDDKRYTADISKVTHTIYNVNVTESDPFTITEQGTNTGWGGSIDMLEMYNNLDTDWQKLNHGYTNNPTINPLTYNSARVDNYDVNNKLTSQSYSSPVENDMPYRDYGAISAYSGTGTAPNHKYYNVAKNNNLTNDDTDTSENLQTSSISFVVQTTGTNRSDEERFMCLTGEKDVTITSGLSVTTNNYPSTNGKYISSNNHYLTITNDTIDNTSIAQTTAWAYADSKLYTANSTHSEIYLVCSNIGVLSLTTVKNNATNWVYDSSEDVFYATVGNKQMYLTYENSAWKCVALTIVDHYLIHNNTGVYLKHNGNVRNQDLRSSSYAISNPDLDDQKFWWYKDGNNYRPTSTSEYYLSRNNSTSRIYTGETNYLVYDEENQYFYNGNYYLRYNNPRYELSSYNNRSTIIVEPVYSIPDMSYSGDGSFKIYTTTSSTEDATLSIPHTYFPLRYEENSSKPDIKNTGYVVSGGNYFADPYGDIRVSAYPISTSLTEVSQNDSTDSEGKKYKSINTVYTKTFNGNGNYSDTNVNANTFYANSKKYSQSKSALEHVFGGQSNAYGFHFMKRNTDLSTSNPATVPGAVVNGSVYKNLEVPTDCIDFNLKEKGVINFFAGSYYLNSGNKNESFFSLYEIDRDKAVSKAFFSDTQSEITLTYEGLDSAKKMKFSYDIDPFNVTGHTYNHITINGRSNYLVDEELIPFEITNHTSNGQHFFTLDRGNKKIEYFNLKFYDDLDTCYLDIDVTTQRTKLNRVRKIKRVFSDPNDTEERKSYCYEYATTPATYSVPYMYVMGKKVDLDGETPYVEGRVTNSKPSEYTQLEFLMDCIEVGPYGGSIYTTSGYWTQTETAHVYYFEIPMNEGEFALGSVKDYSGAYLMYLDIATNANLIKRTTITEHFVSSENKYKYPLGVAIVVNASSALHNATQSTPIPIDPTESIFMEVDDSYRGVINIELSVVSTVKTATLVRANMPNAPNYSEHANIGYISDDFEKDNIVNGSKGLAVTRDANNNPVTTTFTGTGSTDDNPVTTIDRDIKRINFYDFSVTEGIKWTQITSTVIDGNDTREVYQESNDEEVTSSSIKIYGYDGKSTTKENINFGDSTHFTFNDDENAVTIRFYYATDDYEEVTVDIALDTHIETDNYFEYDGYTIVVSNTGDQITVKILKNGTNIGTIVINNNDPSSTNSFLVPLS